MKSCALLILVAVAAMLLSGCPPEEGRSGQNITQFAPPPPESPQVPAAVSAGGTGNDLRVILVQEPLGQGYDGAEKATQSKLTAILGSGRYDVVAVKTAYQDGRLLRAEVYYHDHTGEK